MNKILATLIFVFFFIEFPSWSEANEEFECLGSGLIAYQNRDYETALCAYTTLGNMYVANA